jgi:hypothetical protein
MGECAALSDRDRAATEQELKCSLLPPDTLHRDGGQPYPKQLILKLLAGREAEGAAI